MSAVEEILSSIDSAQLAAALGTDEGTARNAAAAAIPTLINGLQANASTPDGETGLLAALADHAGDDLAGDRVDLAAVDTTDGRKIVSHALADDPARLQAVSGLDGGLLAKLLPLLAPIVMNYLARKLGMGPSGGRPGSSGGGLGDLLGGMLGGASAGGGLGGLLGQVLGGGAATPATPAAPAGGQPGSGVGTGGIFIPGNPPDMPIPIDEDTSAHRPPAQGQGSSLGDLLGQILGR